jgi:hypothetical protein
MDAPGLFTDDDGLGSGGTRAAMRLAVHAERGDPRPRRAIPDPNRQPPGLRYTSGAVWRYAQWRH